MILKCTCDNYKGNRLAASYQDTVYGKGMRVHTPIDKKEPKGKHWRCTICLMERTSDFANQGETKTLKKNKSKTKTLAGGL